MNGLSNAFESFDAVRTDAATQKGRCLTVYAKDDRILFSEDGGNVHFGDATLRLTHYALGQLAGMARVPMLARARAPRRGNPLEGGEPLLPSQPPLPHDTCRRRSSPMRDPRPLRTGSGRGRLRTGGSLPTGFTAAMPTVDTDSPAASLGSTNPALFCSNRDSFAFFYGDKSPREDDFGGLHRGSSAQLRGRRQELRLLHAFLP